jgi:hypothetical protein
MLSAIVLHPSRYFFRVVGGAVVNVPVTWYLPSPPLMEGVGSPSLSVPIKAIFVCVLEALFENFGTKRAWNG